MGRMASASGDASRVTPYLIGTLLCIASFLALQYAYKLGLKRGEKLKDDHFALGYQRGHQDADNWWINQESAVEQIRQKIWREEAQL